MRTLLNVVGFMLTIGSALVLLRTLMSWQGMLRVGIFLFLLGFVSFGLGFLWDIFAPRNASPDINMIFFSLGAAFLLFGAKRIFAFSAPRA